MASVTTSREYTMQVNVPHRHYGECSYFMPKEMTAWLYNRGLNYSMVGNSSWGTGYDEDGITNAETSYIVRKIPSMEDCTVFKIMFPKTEIYISEKHND